jgi:hypothetical protein
VLSRVATLPARWRPLGQGYGADDERSDCGGAGGPLVCRLWRSGPEVQISHEFASPFEPGGRFGLRVRLLASPFILDRRWEWVRDRGSRAPFPSIAMWVAPCGVTSDHTSWFCVAVGERSEVDPLGFPQRVLWQIRRGTKGPRNRFFDHHWAARLAMWFGASWEQVELLVIRNRQGRCPLSKTGCRRLAATPMVGCRP